MSSGHRKGEPSQQAYDRYRWALRDPHFQAWLRRSIRINYSYPIPYLAGYSQDGHTIYIDKDFSLLRLVPGLVEHEKWEKTAIDIMGLPYLPAHEIAIVAENQLVRTKLRMEPRKYNKMLVPYIKKDEAEPRAEQLPPDLDMTPYKGSKWYHAPLPSRVLPRNGA